MAVGGANSDWRHGTNGATGVLTDFTAKTRSASLNTEAENVDSTTFGDSYREYEQSFKNGTISSVYKYDDTLYGQLSAIYNAGDTVSFQLSPAGTASGKPKITGTAFMLSFNQTVEIGELISYEVEWQISGAITWGTHS